MKKKLLLGLLLVAVPFMLAGCEKKEEKSSKSNTKTISCYEKSDDLDTKLELEYNEKKEEFTGGKLIYTIYLENSTESEKENIKNGGDIFCDYVQGQLSLVNDDCDYKVGKKDVKVTLGINLDEINEEYEDEELEDIVDDIESHLIKNCEIK